MEEHTLKSVRMISGFVWLFLEKKKKRLLEKWFTKSIELGIIPFDWICITTFRPNTEAQFNRFLAVSVDNFQYRVSKWRRDPSFKKGWISTVAKHRI